MSQDQPNFAEVYCVECEELLGMVVIGDKLGFVASEAVVPLMWCEDCAARIAEGAVV